MQKQKKLKLKKMRKSTNQRHRCISDVFAVCWIVFRSSNTIAIQVQFTISRILLFSVSISRAIKTASFIFILRL